ncbi:MAG: lipoprotein-releasing system permease protein [Methanosaeta sp. ASM2]|nr:MAG: lipoprotein-releasing system permease protein [Methanosaeta sp. ASM2]
MAAHLFPGVSRLSGSILPAFEIAVVRRHIAYRRRGTFLSIAAIALAVAISLISVSMQDGFQGMLFDIIVEDLPHVTVSPREGDEYIYLYHSLMDRIWIIPGVVAASLSLGAPATFSYKDNIENVDMMGVNPHDMDKIYNIGKHVFQGSLASIQDGRKVVLGEKTAELLNVKMGQTVFVSFPDAKSTSLVVSGIFSLPTGWPENIAFVSLSTARDFVGEGDVVSSVDIKLEDVYLADGAAAILRGYGYKAESWQALYPEILKTLAIEEFQNNLIMLLILIIAAFGIGSVMYMLVNEKTSEIGMFMAMGASGRNIMNIFLLESGILGLLGGLVGAVLGLIVAFYLKSLEIKMEAPGGQEITIPVAINAFSFLTIVLMAAALSVLAGLYPAWKASRLDPAIAING